MNGEMNMYEKYELRKQVTCDGHGMLCRGMEDYRRRCSFKVFPSITSKMKSEMWWHIMLMSMSLGFQSSM